MNQTAIFAPFLTMMLLTLIVWFYMYSRRIPLIQKSKIDPNALTAAELARISPPAVSNPSDNLKNLFELPTLFYGWCSTSLSPTRRTRCTLSLHGFSQPFGCCTVRRIAPSTLFCFDFGFTASPRWHCGSW